MAKSHQVDVVANNLANADTLGFKKDIPTFKEYLAVLERQNDPGDVRRGPIHEKEFYPLDGRDESYVVVDGTATDFRQGHLKVTHGSLDCALEGPGFFEISTPAGIRYTRQGSFKIGPDGRLITSEGYPVLAAEPAGLAAAAVGQQNAQAGATFGPVPGTEAARWISLRDRSGAISINEDGEIYAGDQRIGRLAIREFLDTQKLKKIGSGLFENIDPQNYVRPSKTIVRQGVLETSNVNPVEEMTKLIKAHRLFEQDLKAMKTHGELLQKEVNEVGKL